MSKHSDEIELASDLIQEDKVAAMMLHIEDIRTAERRRLMDKANARHLRLCHTGPDFEDCGMGKCIDVAWLLSEQDDERECSTCGKTHR